MTSEANAKIEMAGVGQGNGNEKNNLETENEKHRPTRGEVALELISTMSVSGLNRLASTTNPKIRLFWGTLFVLGFLGFLYNLIAITNQYAKAPILTQMDYEYKTFSWPHITFCNPSSPIPFWAIKDGKSKWDAFKKEMGKYGEIRYNGSSASTNIDIDSTYFAMSSLNPLDFYNVNESSLIYSLRLIMRQSHIAATSGQFDNLKKVPKSFFPNLFIKRMGSSRFPMMCFSLHLEHLDKFPEVGDPSDVEGVKIMILMDNDSYGHFNFGYEKRKMKVYFNVPFGTLQSSTIHSLYAGTDSEFRLTENVLHRKGKCSDKTFNVKEYNHDFSKTFDYKGNYEDCRQYFSQKLYYNQCNCYNPFLPIYKLHKTLEPPKLCLNISIYDNSSIRRNVECLNNVTATYKNSTWFEKELKKLCSEYLLPKCKASTYDYVQNTFRWEKRSDMNKERLMNSKSALSGLPNNKKNGTADLDFLELNLASIQFTRTSKSVVAAIEEYEYPFSQFMSDFGGILGLWLGFSVIGFFEIFELIVVVCSTKSK